MLLVIIKGFKKEKKIDDMMIYNIDVNVKRKCEGLYEDKAINNTVIYVYQL